MDTPLLDPADDQLVARTAVYAALGEPIRLAIADSLQLTDLTPHDIVSRLDVRSNLLAHHLNVLQRAGLVERARSRGDGRRRYLRLSSSASQLGLEVPGITASRVVFACSGSGVRSQLAARMWSRRSRIPVAVATEPGGGMSEPAIEITRLLDLWAVPVPEVATTGQPHDVIVTLCDVAREAGVGLPGTNGTTTHLHWSMAEPDLSMSSHQDIAGRLLQRIDGLQRAVRP